MNEPNITIKDIEMKIIYIRFRGSYIEFRRNSRRIFKQLFAFATRNNLINPEFTKVLTMYNDNPFITDEKNLRTSVAMTVPNDIDISEEGEICVSKITGRFGIGSFNISCNEYEKAWEKMYQGWLFKGEYQARDAVPFELYVTEPPMNSKDKSSTDIYIPIE